MGAGPGAAGQLQGAEEPHGGFERREGRGGRAGQLYSGFADKDVVPGWVHSTRKQMDSVNI